MSRITDALIFVGYACDELIAAIEEAEFDQQRFALMSMDAAGGSKVFTGEIYAASFNYVSPDRLKEWWESLPFSTYDNAYLLAECEVDHLALPAGAWK